MREESEFESRIADQSLRSLSDFHVLIRQAGIGEGTRSLISLPNPSLEDMLTGKVLSLAADCLKGARPTFTVQTARSSRPPLQAPRHKCL